MIAEQFDCCICTQFLPNEIISQLKTDKKIRTRLICVVTDYNVHRFWLAGAVDTYAVACREAKQELLRMGVTQEKIQVTGVPVNPKFLSQPDKQQLINEMGLKPGMLTVLML
ncbi:MAG: UDP-N-acetylglucosamine--LPS N-acetylglucosamine transferase, partial [Candidatus Omnitrophota bacterium]|nr:UDP-N-acetylglucosamine--LPS N-acetylglucosamine transferase [Candidatus Omnitrophota bacterium]